MHTQVQAIQAKKRALELASVLNRNTHTLIAMTADEFVDFAIKSKLNKGWSIQQISEWVDTLIQNSPAIEKTVRDTWERNKSYIKTTGAFTPVLRDTRTLTALALDMQKGGNVFTKFQIKVINKRPNVIFKGYAGLRSHLTGTKYLANNLKVVSIGVGTLGALKAIKGGILFAVVFSVAFYGIEQLLNDKATWHNFIAGVSFDVVSAVTGGAIAWGAVCTYVGGTTAMIAVGPIAVVVIAGFVLVEIFDIIGMHYGVKQKIAAGLIKAEKRMIADIEQTKIKAQRGLNYADEDPLGFIHRLFGVPYLPIK